MSLFGRTLNPSPEQISSALTTASAKEAFNRVQALRPSEWTVSEERDGRVYVSAEGLFVPYRGALKDVGGIFAKSLDEAVIAQEKKILDGAAEAGALITNPGSNQRREYNFNPATKQFSPR